MLAVGIHSTNEPPPTSLIERDCVIPGVPGVDLVSVDVARPEVDAGHLGHRVAANGVREHCRTRINARGYTTIFQTGHGYVISGGNI